MDRKFKFSAIVDDCIYVHGRNFIKIGRMVWKLARTRKLT